MINLILISLFLNVLFWRKDALYCGLFGWVGSSISSFDFTKIKFLGFVNDNRGGDGFGVYTGISHYRSISPARFTAGIRTGGKVTETLPDKYPIYIGHARKKSTGKVDIDHTQPILYNKAKSKIKTCLAHNGTIQDVKELVEKLGCKDDPFFEKMYNLSDTQILTFLINKARVEKTPFNDILGVYLGSASLLMHFSNDPKAIYVFRGESKTYENGILSEDRPLFYLKDKRDGFYFSSLKDPLEMIKGENEEAEQVPPNILFRFSGNKMTEVESIDRSNAYRSYGVDTTTNTTTRRMGYRQNGAITPIDEISLFPKEGATNECGLNSSPTRNCVATYFDSIHDVESKFEYNAVKALDYVASLYSNVSIFRFGISIPTEIKSGRIFFYRGRYLSAFRINNVVNYALANGVLTVDSEGFLITDPEIKGTRYHMISGVIIKENSHLNLHKLLSSSTNAWEKNGISVFKVEFSDINQLERFYEGSEYPIAPFSSPSGVLMILDSFGLKIPFVGTYTPPLGKFGYIVSGGYVKSQFLINKSNSSKSEGNKIINHIVAKTLVLCSACKSDAVMCNICEGEGYLSEDDHAEYMCDMDIVNQDALGIGYCPAHSVEREMNSDEDIPNKNDVVEVIDDGVQNQINSEVIENLQRVAKLLITSNNELEMMGEKTKLLESAQILFSEMETEIFGLIGYE